MGQIALYIAKVLVFALITIGLYNALRFFVLDKFKPKLTMKIIVTVILAALIAVVLFFSTKYGGTSWQEFIGAGFAVLMMLTILDLWTGGKKGRSSKKSSSKSDSFKPKPKAKPNRVKNKN